MINPTETINQLTASNNGMNRLVAMTGASKFLKGDDFVSFKLPKLANGINYIKIILTGNDTYNMELGKISNRACPEMKKLGLRMMVPEYKVKTIVDGLYDTDLKAAFEKATKLYLTL